MTSLNTHRCVLGPLLAAALAAGMGPATAGELKGSHYPADASPTLHWAGAYWSAGVALQSGGVDIHGIGSKDRADIVANTAGVFAALGYNSFYGRWFLGIEADLGGGGMDRSKTISGLGTVSVDTAIVGSLRPRLGYAWDNVLLYGTAGIALSDAKISSPLGWKDDHMLVGAVIGLGAEIAVFEAWNLRAEALAYGFGIDDANVGGTKREIDMGYGTLRLGVSRKF